MAATEQTTTQGASGANDGLSMSPRHEHGCANAKQTTITTTMTAAPGAGTALGGQASSRTAAHAPKRNSASVRRQELSQDQFDALVSLTYNAGARGSRGTYNLLEQGDFKGAASNTSKMTLTTIDGKQVVARGLISRRAEESAPFRSVETAKK